MKAGGKPSDNGRSRSISDQRLKEVLRSSDCSLEFHIDESRAILLVSGEIDVANNRRLAECLDLLLDEGLDRVDIDLRMVTFMDVAGIRSILEANRTLNDRGGKLRVLSPNFQIRRVIEVMGMTEEVEILPLMSSESQELT